MNYPYIGSDAWPYITQITADLNGVPMACGEQFARFNPDRFVNFPFASTLFSFIDGVTAYYFFLAIFLIISFISFYLFAGLYSKKTLVRIISAATYSISTVMAAIILWGNPSTLIGFAYIPGIIWCAIKAFGDNTELNAAYALTGGVFTGLIALGGGWYYVAYISIFAILIAIEKLHFNKLLRAGFFAAMGFEFVAGAYASGMIKHIPDFIRLRTSYLSLQWYEPFTIFLFGQSHASPITNAIPLIISPLIVFASIYGIFLRKKDWRFAALIIMALICVTPIPSIDTARAVAPLFFILCAYSAEFIAEFYKIFPKIVFGHLILAAIIFLFMTALLVPSMNYSVKADEIAKLTGKKWLELAPEFETKPLSLQYELVKRGVKVVNPYSSVQEKRQNCTQARLIQISPSVIVK